MGLSCGSLCLGELSLHRNRVDQVSVLLAELGGEGPADYLSLPIRKSASRNSVDVPVTGSHPPCHRGEGRGTRAAFKTETSKAKPNRQNKMLQRDAPDA